jgi:choline monooxygenase
LQLSEAGMDSEDLVHIQTRVYKGIKCNWKVYCDNNLHGGYHVPFAHKGLADSINMERYKSPLFENVSIQVAEADRGKQGSLQLC